MYYPIFKLSQMLTIFSEICLSHLASIFECQKFWYFGTELKAVEESDKIESYLFYHTCMSSGNPVLI